jgi:hypothetical protein
VTSVTNDRTSTSSFFLNPPCVDWIISDTSTARSSSLRHEERSTDFWSISSLDSSPAGR